MTQNEIEAVLSDHALWLRDQGGKRADLRWADLRWADLRWANLRGANLREADLRWADLRWADLRGANLRGADLRWANLREADLSGADLSGTNLSGTNLSWVDLSGADLRSAHLLCQGNMRELRTMHIDTWAVAYTDDTLQIGCQRHPIDKWREWNTEAGRKWIAEMDKGALAWADRNLALILQIIDANPATPTGHERGAADAEVVA